MALPWAARASAVARLALVEAVRQKRAGALTVLLCVLALSSAAAQQASADVTQQRGFCQKPVARHLRFDVEPDWEMANTICCHNTKYAEPSGYFRTSRVRLFSRFKPEEQRHTFYDSVCGVPLFTAPVGRSLAEWQAESDEHGWPSFRPDEVVGNNVLQFAGGEVRSVCGTHLGHNIPDGKGPRYCIDLVCISGYPAAAVSTAQGPRLASVRGRSTQSVLMAIRRLKRKIQGLRGARRAVGRRRLLQVGTGQWGGEGQGVQILEEEPGGELEGLKVDMKRRQVQNVYLEAEKQRLVAENARLARILAGDPSAEATVLHHASHSWLLPISGVCCVTAAMLFVTRTSILRRARGW